MSTPAYVDSETITQDDRAQSSRVHVPLPDDPYVAVRQAQLVDTESEPEEAPSEAEELQSLGSRVPFMGEELEAVKPSRTRIDSSHSSASSDSTTPLSPNHPLTHVSPTPTPTRVSFHQRTKRMAVCTQPTLSSGMSARIAETAALSPSSFHKRYRSSYETSSSSSSSTLLGFEDEGLGFEEEVALGGQQQAVPVVDTAVSEPLGLGYGAARRRALESVEEIAPISPSSHIVPSLIASPVATPTATISVDEDQFIEVGAQLELHGSILHDHTQRLDALPPTLRYRFRRPVLALEAWAGRVDTRLADMSRDRYDDHRVIHDMLVQQASMQRELQEMSGRVATLEKERGCREP
ncbi:hypothetical protein Tco_0704287 [Tanacetum coccineum]|uniref:Uncharacterized protein n=1 Tax=Tanacetum coccineum TaxID=301880 RepID=A0ABQ4Y2R7_9ASTR